MAGFCKLYYLAFAFVIGIQQTLLVGGVEDWNEDNEIRPTKKHFSDMYPSDAVGIMKVKIGIMRRAKKRFLDELDTNVLPIHRTIWHRKLLEWSKENGISPQEPELCTNTEPVFLKSENGICASVFGYYQGGLSNTVGFINDGLNFAIKNGFGFVFPYVRPPEHFLHVGMVDMFQDLSEEEEEFPVYDDWDCVVAGSDCIIRSKVFPDDHDISLSSPNILEEMKKRSWLQRLPKPMVDQARNQSCQVIAFLESIMDTRVNFVYSKTHKHLSQQYFRHECTPWKLPSVMKPFWGQEGQITILVHHRLGDLKKKTGENSMRLRKHLSPLYPLIVAHLLSKIVDSTCLHVVISTETGYHEEINAIQKLLPEGSTNHLLAFPYSKRWIEPGWHRDKVSFESMIRADILVAGMSGFSRLAATLGRNARIAPKFGTEHPLHSISEDLLLLPDLENSFWAFPEETEDAMSFYKKGLDSALRSSKASKYVKGISHLLKSTNLESKCQV